MIIFYLLRYEPWKAPIEVQEKANCIIGRDYPNRLVNHTTAGEMNRAKMEVKFNKFESGPLKC